MADTYTPHYNLTKPTVGGDPDTWGGLLNANFDTIDSAVYSAKTLANGRLLNVQLFTASGTYNPTPGTGAALVFGWGAGGGGGGAGTGASGNGYSQNVAPGGNSGAGAIWWWPNPTAQTVTVGAGGAGGAPTVHAGAGGTSSIGSLLVVPGGAGAGSAQATSAAVSNSAPLQTDYPSVTAGTLLLSRVTEMGEPAIYGLMQYTPRGGVGMFAARPPYFVGASAGPGGWGAGSGGDGALCTDYGQQLNGGAGSNGQFIIFEFAAMATS